MLFGFRRKHRTGLSNRTMGRQGYNYFIHFFAKLQPLQQCLISLKTLQSNSGTKLRAPVPMGSKGALIDDSSFEETWITPTSNRALCDVSFASNGRKLGTIPPPTSGRRASSKKHRQDDDHSRCLRGQEQRKWARCTRDSQLFNTKDSDDSNQAAC